MLISFRQRKSKSYREQVSSERYASLYESVLNNSNFNEHYVNTLFKNILELDIDQDKSVLKAIDLYMELYNHMPIAKVNSYRFAVTEGISKVRDAIQFKNSLKYRMSRAKNKMINHVQKKMDELKDKHIKTQSLSGEDNNQEEVEKAQQEAYELFYKSICEVCAYDRILNNHLKISKRFDLDRLVIENVITKQDALDLSYKVAKLIDTYNMTSIQKFRVATEEYLYTLSTHGCKYDTKAIIENMRDFFLVNSEDPKKFINLLENTINDMNYYINFNNVTKDKCFNEEEIKSLLMNDRYKDGLEAEIKLDREKIDDILTMFKFNVNINSFKKSIEDAYNVCKYTFVEYIEDFCKIIEMKTDLPTEYAKFLVDFIDSKINEYDDKLKAKFMNKIADIYEKYIPSINTDKDIKLEDKVKEFISMARSLKVSDKIQDELNPYVVAEKFDILAGIMESLNEKDPLEDIKASISSYGHDELYKITEISKKNKSFIIPCKLKNIFESYANEVRKSKGIEKYITLGCINENIKSLSETENEDESYEESIDINRFDEVIANTKILELYANAISDKHNYPTVLREMDIANTISMTVEKFKSKLGELSKAESIASRTFDAQLSQLKNMIVNTDDIKSEDREAVISGRILPKASRIIKLAIVSGLGYMVSAALPVIIILGYFGMSMNNQSKERRKILEEIDVELEMTKRYLKKAEDNNQLEKQRELLKIKKKLESQKARLSYNMVFKHGESLPNAKENDDD